MSKQPLKENLNTQVGIERKLEHWRPIKNLSLADAAKSLALRKVHGVLMALISEDTKLFSMNDLVTDDGLNALCGQAFDGSGSRPAVFKYVAIGTDATAPANDDTELGAEVMRVQGTYAKDPGTGECSMDAEFIIDGTYALAECGCLNAASEGTLLAHDTYPIKNVVLNDVIRIYYTGKFQRVA
jgi:hypothetical protein